MESRIHRTLSQRERKNEKYKHISLEMETSTHFPMLMKCVQATDGLVAELGSGIFSTPLLHWMLFETDRKLITYESYEHYLEFAKKFETPNHEVKFVKDWAKEEFDHHYSVVLIDHSIPMRAHTRGDDALRFKDKADYIVLHDAGPNPYEKYGYLPIYDQFKYVYHWTKSPINTTVLSNSHDLEWLKT